MGGERFDMPQPESYLFGENDDLNFIGNRPTPFPYPNTQGNEPTKMLKSLVNIRKSSLRFIKTAEPTGKNKTEPETNVDIIEDNMTRYNVEFTFDADIKCAITIFYFATEEIVNGRITYHPRDPSMNSETYNYKQGANQTFSQSSHIIDPSQFSDDDWQYNNDTGVIPVVVQCLVEDEEHAGHSHVTFATVDLTAELGYVLKPLKQKQFINGMAYLLQEIYGIENKNPEKAKDPEDEIDETGAECIICMSEMRDTLILPCRHLCLCSECAESLRYQSSNCPICRSNFRALLQLRAMRKKQPQAIVPRRDGDREEVVVNQEGVPAGYEAVSLFEALNGPSSLRHANSDATMTRHNATRGDKAEKKKLAKRHHSSDVRVHERSSVVNEVEGVDEEAEHLGAGSQTVKSPAHSTKKTHASHTRHSAKSGEKRNAKQTGNVETKEAADVGAAAGTDYGVYPILESDPGADDADDEQSSDEDTANGGESCKQKQSVVGAVEKEERVDKEPVKQELPEMEEFQSDPTSAKCDHIEMDTLHIEYIPNTEEGVSSGVEATTPQESPTTPADDDSQTKPGTTPPEENQSSGVTTNAATDMSSYSSTGSAQVLLPPP